MLGDWIFRYGMSPAAGAPRFVRRASDGQSCLTRPAADLAQ